jgi:DNA-binding MarR family transcriptional regulator
VEVGLFTAIATAPDKCMTNDEIREVLELHPRATPDFTDCLVSLSLLERQGDETETARYYNAPEAALFLDKTRDSYIGKPLEVASSKWFRMWADHPSMLKDKARGTDKLQAVIDACNREARVKLFYTGRVGSTGLTAEEKKLSPEALFELGFGFWNSRILLTAVEWHLFTMIEASEKRCMSSKKIQMALDLRPSTTEEFLDALVEMKMLESYEKRKDERVRKYYRNTPAGAMFLDCAKKEYVGGAMEMHSRQLYCFVAGLLDSLKTGESQSGCNTAKPYWKKADETPAIMEDHITGMRGWSHGPLDVFARSDDIVDFSKFSSMCDVGGASGQLACYVAQSHSHIDAITADLPSVLPHAKHWTQVHGCADRVTPIVLDFHSDPFPKADLITMATTLLDWNLSTKKQLIRKAYDALPDDGVFVCIDVMIDDDRRTDTMAMCVSLMMLVLFGSNGGFTFTGKDIAQWCEDEGFKSTQVFHLMGPNSAIVAYK